MTRRVHLTLAAALLGSSACTDPAALETSGPSAREGVDDAPAPRGASLDGGHAASSASGGPDSSVSRADSSVAKAEKSDLTDAATSTGCATFEGSYDAIQALIFERHGCTASTCHGEAKVGGLDLRRESAWASLVDVPSTNSSLARVQPGTAKESFLFLKLRAATEPGSVQVTGSPMPVGSAALSAKELAAMELWILKGAPKTGNVANELGVDVGSLLDACLPMAAPVKSPPLEVPAADQGVQIILPHYLLKAETEIEQCTPFAFDFSDKVPARLKDDARDVMYTNSYRLRQDPQSHHLIVWNPVKPLSSVAADDPDWMCRGGTNDGKHCNAQLGSADCPGDGVCAGKSNPGSLCGIDTLAFGSGSPQDVLAGLLGLGPRQLTLDELAQFAEIASNGGMPQQLANAQAPQQYLPAQDGVYWEVPMRGILWADSHAFNLTQQDTTLDARMNFYFADKLEREMKRISDSSKNGIADGQPPFTRKTYCSSYVVPQDYSLSMLTGHTHRHGEHFWVKDAKGQQIYESFDYNDPVFKRFEPWLEFHSANEADRTLEYCATYNNGLTKDDKPDVDLVTRQSRMLERVGCTPVACTKGKVTAACSANADCDSMPGAGDGECDACPITAGQSTENEMFVLMPWLVLPPK